VLPIDSTLAGRAYQTVTVQSVPLRGADGTGESYQVWIPLVDGTARLGVLSLAAQPRHSPRPCAGGETGGEVGRSNRAAPGRR
jgi:hypothetical protein